MGCQLCSACAQCQRKTTWYATTKVGEEQRCGCMAFFVQSRPISGRPPALKVPTARIHKNKVPWYGIPRTRCDKTPSSNPLSWIACREGPSQRRTHEANFWICVAEDSTYTTTQKGGSQTTVWTCAAWRSETPSSGGCGCGIRIHYCRRNLQGRL